MATRDRTYHRTHPWLTFHLDLRDASFELWMLLGEARSKVAHLSESLLKPETGERLMELYLAKGVHATTAIEGNTLSEEEVLKYLDEKRAPPSEDYRRREIENIISAYNRVQGDLLGEGEAPNAPLTPEVLKEYNRLILDGLDLAKDVVPGEIHERRVGVGRYLGPPSEECDYLLQRLCEWLNGPDFEPSKGDLG